MCSPKTKRKGSAGQQQSKGQIVELQIIHLWNNNNVRTVHLENKRNELVNNYKTHAIPIRGIVDYKIVHNLKIFYQHLENSTVVTSSAWRNANNASSGGVGLIINKKAKSVLAKVESWNKRITVANFNRNPALTIIVHYSSVEGSNEAEYHYNQLPTARKEVPKHNMLIVIGDFNTHLRRDIVKYSFQESTDSNDKLVHDFVEETGLFITNTSFQKKLGNLWKFVSDMWMVPNVKLTT